ncbi:MAG: transporter, family, multidrug resistance protein [Thermotogaceae bacterium]|nr:transporter, family, multidrug resistance protein [Thermotogaceae bacterium]
MYFISLGAISIGILYGIVNMMLIPLLVTHFQNPEIPGLLISFGMILSGVISPFIGAWSDKSGKRLPFISLIMVLTVSGCFFILSSIKILITIGAVFFVFGTYSFVTPYSSLVADYSSTKQRGIAFSLVMGMTNFASFLASLIINGLYDKGNTETLLTLMCVNITAFVVLSVYIFFKRPTDRIQPIQKKENSLNDRTTRLLKKYPFLWLYFSIVFFTWFSIGGLFPYITSFLSEESSISIGQASVWFGLSTLLSSVFSFGTGFFCKLIKESKLFFSSLTILTFITGFVSLFYITVFGEYAALYGFLFFVLLSASLGFFYSLSTSVLSLLVSSKDQGKVFGMNSLFMIFSQAISVGIMGKVIELKGYRMMVFLGFLGFLFASVFTFVLFFTLNKQKNNNNKISFEKKES